MNTFNILSPAYTSTSEGETCEKSPKTIGNVSKMVFEDDFKMAK